VDNSRYIALKYTGIGNIGVIGMGHMETCVPLKNTKAKNVNIRPIIPKKENRVT